MRVILSVMLSFLLVISSAYGIKVPKVDLHVSQEEYAISFLPVQKGEVAVLHLASGDHYMINTGSFKDRNQLYYYFNQIHIDNIKGLIITEKSEVDERMIAELVKRFSIEEIVVGKSLVPYIPKQFSGIIHTIQEDQTYTFTDELAMRAVHDGNETREGLDFSITFFHHRFLWLSSQSSHSEEVLLTKPLKNVNIVKIPVHSKSEGMSHRLLEHVDPQTAILYRSKERLLNGDMLEAINEAWIDLYLTGQHGLIAVKFNKRNYEVLTFDQED
jgi:beta-lactamase superfamily II metal-dependent hydrolase